MRAWQSHTKDLDASGARLLILTGDDREVLAAKVAEHGFTELAIAPASPADWDALGVKNEKRERLPHPTTLVLGPKGEEWLRETHVNFRERSDPERALAALAARGASPETASGTTPQTVSWDDASSLQVVRQAGKVVVQLTIAEGFHAYGTRETTGVPVYLRIDDGPRAKGPEGVAKQWSGGTSYVLEGTVTLEVAVEGSGPVSGSVGWQLCTDSTCSAPRNQPFQLDGL